ncbi:CSC1-like protein RXW8 isoform X1 [Cucurbita maxima]|uniref:CSC1-like protein RXW8 isoform X1 n=1 Tax=Cucurbita maxima TaxID=3661 RepID=A0A6J1KJY1_CUCMA|nr:CSC1-like protein RXW8 isoform X1 [Cucurbita maxima]XP_023002592.1 CSC1-like protein RXW8 isoform X1 [Cucurbita maxima]
MEFSALLTSVGINIGICVVLFSLYSILRKQPSNITVYFGRKIASRKLKHCETFCFDRFVPSPSWIVKAWETTEEEILALDGLDSVVFLRIIIFSIRVFSIAAITCLFLVLPVNYYGQETTHKLIPSESLDVFSIENIKENSKWLCAHCIALYVICCSACVLLYFEYLSISQMRLIYITGAQMNPTYFTVLVRSIPWSPDESYSETVRKFFTNYHESGYLSHQMIYRSGTVQKLLSDAEKMYNMMKENSVEMHCQKFKGGCFCAGPTNSFAILPSVNDSVTDKNLYGDMDMLAGEKECSAAFVFFKTRYAALMAATALQSANPMSWATDLAPAPHDVYWSNLSIPYRQLWIRKIGTLVAATAFMLVFLLPVTLVQSMTQLEQLQQAFPFLKGLLKKKYMSELVTGYLPSVILILFMYLVPPTMMSFSALEGSISRSGRKRSACLKVLYFTIWNVFFVNVFTGSILRTLNVFFSVKDIPATFGKAVPAQASFFLTYVLSSGWASLSCEVMQLFPLTCNLIRRWILRIKSEPLFETLSFPYHTEVPRILLFGFLGFTCCILAPLITPFLLFYFFLAYLVYKNQILNVYVSKYESGGQFWPIAHNTTIFAMVVAQIIALGVFGLKESPVASGFTIPLIIGTLLFHEYCRQRFGPIFKNTAAEVLIEMDRKDEQCGRLEEMYKKLRTAYCQFTLLAKRDTSTSGCSSNHNNENSIIDTESAKPGKPLEVHGLWNPPFHLDDMGDLGVPTLTNK